MRAKAITMLALIIGKQAAGAEHDAIHLGEMLFSSLEIAAVFCAGVHLAHGHHQEEEGEAS